MRPRAIAIVAGRELREAIRSRWFVVAAGCFFALSLGLAMLGLAGAARSGLAGFDRTTASVLNLALVFVPLLALALGALGIAGELEDGSLAALLAQPVTRLEVYGGIYAGLFAALAASIAAGFGATAVIIAVWGGGGDARAFAGLVALVMLLGGATLALGTALATATRGRARAIGAVVGVWLVLVYVSDLGTIGLTVARALAPAQVFVLALLNPVEQARVLGTLALAGRPDVLGPVGLYGIDHFGAAGLAAVLVAALLAAGAVPLALGYATFRRLPIT
jgi:Cu-processing system permease protein